MLNLLTLAPMLIKGIIDYKNLENQRENIEKQKKLEEEQNKQKQQQFEEYKQQMKNLAISGARANMATRGINLTSDMAKANLKSKVYDIDRELENFKSQQNFKTANRDIYYKNLLDKNFYQTLNLPFNWLN